MKKIITILALMITGLSYSQSINDNLLLHYPISGDANDVSGNGFHGIVNATLTTDRFGNLNEAYSFNGKDEYIDFPIAVELKPELPVSFSYWLKMDNLQPENAVFFTTDFAQDNHSGVWMNLSSAGFLTINFGDATGNTSIFNRRTKEGTTLLSSNKWYFIVGIVKGPADMEIYIDCVNDNGSYKGSGGNLKYTANPGSIGRKDANTNLPEYYFMGSLDDFRYWNRELTLDDIDSLCNNLGSVPEKPNIILNEISVYPNPAEDILYIEVENIEIENIILVNALGQIIDQKIFQPELRVSFLNPGIYFLHFLDKEKTLIDVKKFIKK